MINENLVKKLYSIKDSILFILISILLFIPILKNFFPTYSFAIKNDYTILKIIGILGIYFFVSYLYFLYKKSKDKKEFFKVFLPIFILFLYMIWTFISSIFSPNKSLAFLGTSYRKDGYVTYILYAGCFGLSFGITSTKMKKALLYLFSAIAILSIVITEISKLGWFYKIICNINSLNGSFDNSNHYGYYLLMVTSICSLLFITEKNKFLKILSFCMYSILLYYLILNNTFGCYLALILTFFILLTTVIIKKEKKSAIIVCICIFFLLSIFTNNNSQNIAGNNIHSLSSDLQKIVTKSPNDSTWKKTGSGRTQLWIHGLQFIAKRPILGYGPENLENLYLNLGIRQDRAHNLLIQLATTSGIPGLILYISAIGIILVRSFKKFNLKNQIHTICLFSVIAYLISAMFGNSMYYTSPYFFILLGFLFSELINLQDC